MLTAERILENIRGRCEGAEDHILVFWCQILSNREDFCRRINGLKGDLDLTPIALRGDGFDNPNALLSDLNKLIREHRNQFDRGPRRLSDNPGPIVLLLVSRTAFTLPQISSLTTLPDWFPRLGGQSVFIMIEDLTATADGPINAAEAHIADLSEKVFALEVALVNRMSAALTKDRHCGQALFSLIRDVTKENEKYSEFLKNSTEYHSEVHNPRGFRPSLKEKRSLVGRLLAIVKTSSPDEISKRARALSESLALPDLSALPTDSLISVLMRPTITDPSSATRLARNVLVTIFASAQFITAAAHAADYPSYPILLLRSMSFNLRSTLDSVRFEIERLD